MTTNRQFASSTLRPGFLVGVKTSIKGNVDYIKNEIEADHTTAEGVRRAKWETERLIQDPEEFEAAKKTRDKARSLLSSVCSTTAFGLLCPEVAEDDLDKAVAEARRRVDEFNRGSSVTKVYFDVITGRIEQDDVTAVRAINREVRQLLESAKEGVRNLNVEAIRDANSRLTQIGAMLSLEAQAKIKLSIEASRKTAKEIKKLEKSGEQAAIEIDLQTIRRIEEARTAFLDIDTPATEAVTLDHEVVAFDFEPSRPSLDPEIARISAEYIENAIATEKV